MTQTDEPPIKRSTSPTLSTEQNNQDAGSENQGPDQTRRQTLAKAAYVADLLSELRVMSQSENWAMLGYLLEMAMMEAHSLADDRPTVFRLQTKKLWSFRMRGLRFWRSGF